MPRKDYADDLAYQKRYYQANKDRVKARVKAYKERTGYDRLWRESNPDYHREYARKWREANRQRHREIEARRRARKHKAGTIEQIDRRDIYERDGGRCHICSRAVRYEEMHLDHLVPLSAGGEHTALNLRVAHPFCNMSRHDGRIPAQLLLV